MMETVLRILESVSVPWGAAMWQASWQGGVAILVAWGICRAFPRLPQPAQSWLWRLVFIKLLLGLVLVMPAVRVPVLPESYVDAYPVTVAPTVSLPSPSPHVDAGPIPTATPAVAVPPTRRLQISVSALCLLLWLGGVAAGCLAMARAFRRLSVLLHNSMLIDSGVHVECLARLARAMGIARVPLLMSNPVIGSPLLAGTVTPTLFVPTSFADNVDPELLRQVYAHELAHLRRHDLRWSWLLTVGQILFFFHPLVWLAKREWRFWQETACDVKAMDATGSSHREFGRALLLVVQQRSQPRYEVAVAGIGETFHLLKRRLQVMQLRRPTGRKGWAIAIALVLLIGALMLVPFKLGLLRAAATPQPPTGIPYRGIIDGTVATPAGQPAAGATVTWIAYPIDEYGKAQFRELASVKTDDTGKFTFPHSKALWDQSGPGLPLLLIEADGWAMTPSPLRAPTTTPRILSPATTVTVSFVDWLGNPVAGMRVQADHIILKSNEESGIGQSISIPPSFDSRFARVTNTQGECTFENLPQGAFLSLRIEDARYAQLHLYEEYATSHGGKRQTRGFKLAEAPVTIKRIGLTPAATITGTVTYAETGKPAAGVPVFAIRGFHGGGFAEMDYAEAVTDAKGRYRITQLRGGEYGIVVDFRDQHAGEWTAKAITDLPVAAGEQADGVDFALIKGSLITGTITYADTGEPIANVPIWVYSASHPEGTYHTVGTDANGYADVRKTGATQYQVIETDAKGVYRLRVPAGPVHISQVGFSSRGYRHEEFRGKDKNDKTFDIGDGMTKTINFTFEREKRESGGGRGG